MRRNDSLFSRFCVYVNMTVNGDNVTKSGNEIAGLLLQYSDEEITLSSNQQLGDNEIAITSVSELAGVWTM